MTLGLWRALVGAGEATLPPTAVSMLGDRFAPSRLGFATSVYYAGIPVGFACSLAAAGWLVPRFGWRSCFYLIGALGLAAVGLVWRMEDPRPRGAIDGPDLLGGWSRAAGRSPAGCAARSPPSPRSCLLPRGRDSPRVPRARPRSTSSRGWSRSAGSPTPARRTSGSAMILGAGLAGSLALGALTDAAAAPAPGRAALRLRRFSGPCPSPRPPPSTGCRRHRPSSWPRGSSPRRGRSAGSAPMLAAIHERAPAGSRATVIGFGLMTINLVGVGSGAVGHRRDRRPRGAHDRPPDERRGGRGRPRRRRARRPAGRRIPRRPARPSSSE